MLCDVYQEICNSLIIRNSKSFTQNPCDETATDFIKEYFESRSKGILFNIAFTEPQSLFSKSVHTVSEFLLGIKFKRLCEDSIINQIRKNAPISIMNFEYPWFLSCLYHDVFSKYEGDNYTDYSSGLDSFITDQEIKHTIYDTNLPLDINISEIVPTYKEKTVSKYYDYRISQRKVDHGIISGYYAFDRLTKNYLDNSKQHYKKKTFITNKNGHVLIWDENQLWIFGLVADAIIVHNMWHTNLMTSVSNELVPAINNNHEVKLSLTKTPLAYYLSLIDTIEPYKYFESEYSMLPINVINNISMELNGRSIIITRDSTLECDFNKWYKNKMENMGDWLEDTYAEYINEFEIRIYLPHEK